MNTNPIALIMVMLAVFTWSRAENSFPSRPVKVIVPFSPGGGSDTFARLVQRAMDSHELLDEKLVIVNIPGAGGVIGSRAALRAYPDGHTILFLHDGILTAKRSGQAAYGPEAFEPIAVTGEVGAVIAVSENSQYANLEELLSAASENPDTIAFAANIGAPSHYMALALQQAHGSARFRFVQSGGGAKRFGDLKGGHITVSAFSVAELLAFQEGGLRALAYLGEKRHPSLLNVPTARELGVDAVYGNLQGWWAPRNTPDRAIRILADALEKTMETPEMKQKMDELQISPLFLRGEGAGEAWREKAETLSKIAPPAKTFAAPNLPGFLAVVAVIGLLGLLVQSFRTHKKTTTSATSESETRHPSTLFFSFLLASIYLLALEFLPVPFWVLTLFFLVLMAFVFARGQNWKATLTRSLASGVVLCVLCHLFFEVFLGVDLP